jgi:diadenylate cyclase
MTNPVELLQLLVEVAVFATGIYLVLRFLRRTHGSGVVRGLALLLLVGSVSFVILIQVFDLRRLSLVFEMIANLTVLGLVIVFQPEIRRAIVQLGDSPIFGRFFKRELRTVPRLIRSVARLSREKIGALIAIEREGSLASIVETGITIDAEVNSFLIESVFFPKNALHDGAMVIRDDRIVAASCLLPLSENPALDKRLGTRHRAALGLTENTDAVAIVVSEETGKVSAALGAELHVDLSLDRLEELVEGALGRGAAATSGKRHDQRRRWHEIGDALFADPWRKLIATGLALLLWLYLNSQVTDQRGLEFQLRAVDVAAQPVAATGQKVSLDVVLPLSAFTVRGFHDHINNEQIAVVDLEFEGPQHLIDRLEENAGFRVTPTADELRRNDKSFEFDVGQVQSLNPEFQRLLKRMEPRRIRVELERNRQEERSLTLELLMFQLPPADRFPDLAPRLETASATFEPPKVTLFGSDEALQRALQSKKPFLVDLKGLASIPPGDEIRAKLTLAPELADLRLDTDTPIVVLKLAPQYQIFELSVPVEVYVPEQDGSAVRHYVAEPNPAPIRLRASGKLEGDLALKKPDDLKQWASENLLLLAVTRPGADPNDQQVQPLLVFLKPGFKEGPDYRLDQAPVVKVRRRPE